MADDSIFLTPEVLPPAKRPRGNPNWQLSGHKGNPGGVVSAHNKPVRKALLELLAQKPDKVYKPRTKAEKIAATLYNTAMDHPYTPVGFRALKELINRVDGKSAISEEEANAIKEGGSKVLIIDAAGRPPRNHGDD